MNPTNSPSSTEASLLGLLWAYQIWCENIQLRNQLTTLATTTDLIQAVSDLLRDVRELRRGNDALRTDYDRLREKLEASPAVDCNGDCKRVMKELGEKNDTLRAGFDELRKKLEPKATSVVDSGGGGDDKRIMMDETTAARATMEEANRNWEGRPGLTITFSGNMDVIARAHSGTGEIAVLYLC